jgi:hypothetical protein
VKVASAGIDTWSPAWYVTEGSQADRAMRELASIPSAGGSWLMPDRVEGHRVGWFPRSRMVFAEGHPVADGLASPDELPMVLDRLHNSIKDYGVQLYSDYSRKRGRADKGYAISDRLPGFAGIRRLDATADLSFETRCEGAAVLTGVAALARMRQKADIWYDRGQVQTVYFKGHGGKRTLGRWYDKGAEAGTAPRFRLLRPEDQRRFVASSRRGVEELTTSYVREKFQQRFMPLWRASEGVVVAGPDKLTDRLLELVEADELALRSAEQLAGYIALRDRVRDRDRGTASHKRTTEWRRESRLLELGLVPADESGAETTVDLHDVLEQVLDSDAWDRRG